MFFQFEHRVPVAREAVFAFFENPRRLELLHAGWPEVRVLHCPARVSVGAETWVECVIAGCVPLVLGFRHNLFEPPLRFGERAIHGPFSQFVHVHEFKACGSGTIVRDLLEIRLPWHYGGETVSSIAVAGVVKRMFGRRAHALSRLAADGALAGCALPESRLEGN